MKTLIAIPCLDMVHTGFMLSLLALQKPGECQFGVSSSSLVYDSRNNLAKKAVSEGFDRILWLDSDMRFEPDLMKRLGERMDEGLDFVSGIYFSRSCPSRPVFYEKVGFLHNGDSVTPKAVPFTSYEKGETIEVEGAGFGIAMVSVKMVKDVVEKYGLPFSPILGFGEDLSFCIRARELGYHLYCDTSIKAGHIGYKVYNEESWEADRGNIQS